MEYNMIVAVTGISSGLARTLVSKLQSDPAVERIIGIDINDYRADSDKVQFIKTDIRDMDRMVSALQQVDVLFHLAFIVTPPKLPDRKKIYDINVKGSKTVFKAAAANKVKKVIYLSSVAVYGHKPESPPIVTEDSPRLGIETTNFYYSHTKGIVEQFLDQYEKDHPDIAVIRVRPPAIAGPGFFSSVALLIPKGTKTSRRIFPLNQNGKTPMQFIHEEDLTDILLMMVHKDVRGAYNVGGDPVADLRAFMEVEYGHKILPASYGVFNLFLGLEKMWTKMGWIQAHKYNSVLDTTKVETEFDWKPRFDTEQCIREFLDS